jgi:hypothetical protein
MMIILLYLAETSADYCTRTDTGDDLLLARQRDNPSFLLTSPVA